MHHALHALCVVLLFALPLLHRRHTAVDSNDWETVQRRAAASDTDVEAWRAVCDRLASRSISGVDIRGKQWSNAAECYAAVASRTNEARDWIVVSQQLKPGETVPSPDPISKVGAVTKALQADPSRTQTWFTLAAMMTPSDKVSIAHRTYSKLEAFAQALSLDSAHEPSWFELGRAMSASDRVTIGGKEYTRVAAFARAVELAPTTLGSWGYLGSSLADGETVSVAGVPVGRRECFRRVVSLDAKHAIGWLNLGTELGGGSTVDVAGVQYNQRDCFVMCLRSNPKGIAGAWFNLGMVMEPTENVSIWPNLAESFIRNRVECFVRAVTINTNQPQSWFALAEALQPDETVSVTGYTMTKVACYGRVAYLSPTNTTAWQRVVDLLPSEEATVKVGPEMLSRAACRQRLARATEGLAS